MKQKKLTITCPDRADGHIEHLIHVAKNCGKVVWPEAGLHPSEQFEYGRLLTRIERPVQVVTYSRILLRGIQTEIALGRISPDTVQLEWGSEPIIGVFDASGDWGDWPCDFDTAYRRIEDTWLRALRERKLNR